MGKILIACEESQVVCTAFRNLGYEAYSCDLQHCGLFGHSDWHIVGDAIKVAYSGEWEMMIGHPPCTFMSAAGARWMYKGGELQPDRLEKAMKAKEFFLELSAAPIPYIAIENPRPLKVVGLPEQTQIIQPYQFGDPYSKETWLWLKGLPKLEPTNVLTKWEPFLQSGGKNAPISKVRGRARSQTFEGIANAMADQWGVYLTTASAGAARGAFSN